MSTNTLIERLRERADEVDDCLERRTNCWFREIDTALFREAAAALSAEGRERLEEQALRIARHQLNPFAHPYTCGIDSNHAPLVPTVQDGEVVLVCPGPGRLSPADLRPEACPYTQRLAAPATPEGETDEFSCSKCGAEYPDADCLCDLCGEYTPALRASSAREWERKRLLEI
ncbi:MAG TPA: hypothetical protein VFI96_09200, partial [Longimicrobiaceae bacterium]|nr:hypothetical protein [Longimicrobiaceae bacterium]